MSVRRPCKLSQVASSSLILTPGSWPGPRSTSCTTMVRSGWVFLGALGGGGWGTSASNPFGVTGEMTMKMINSTSRTSMSGVTLMFALWPPLGPTAIPMVVLLLPSRRRGRRGRTGLSLIGKQSEVIHSSGADCVHYLDDSAKTATHVGFHIHTLIRLVGQAILDLGGEIVGAGLLAAEVDFAVACNRDQQGVFLVGIRHLLRAVYFSHRHADALLQHARDHHGDDQQNHHY